MTVRVARGSLSRIRERPDFFVVQVQGAADAEAALAALGRAGAEIARLDGGWRSAPGLGPGDTNTPEVDGPLPAGRSGPFVMVQAEAVPYRLLRTIPEVVARHLAEAGVDEAVVAVDPDAELFELGAIPKAVFLRLYPPPPVRLRQRSEIPDPWLAEAQAWVLEGVPADTELLASVGTMGFRVAPAEVVGLFGSGRKARYLVSVLSGDLDGRVRAAFGAFISWEPCLVLAGGGPAATEEDLLATFAAVRDLARRLAPELAYAAIDWSESFLLWTNPRGVEAGLAAALQCDELVFAPCSYQVLGPGHLARLGGPPPGSRPLDGGRVELGVGDPLAWRPGDDRRPGVLARGLELLGPCLVPPDELHALFQAKFLRPKGEP